MSQATDCTRTVAYHSGGIPLPWWERLRRFLTGRRPRVVLWGCHRDGPVLVLPLPDGDELELVIAEELLATIGGMVVRARAERNVTPVLTEAQSLVQIAEAACYPGGEGVPEQEAAGDDAPAEECPQPRVVVPGVSLSVVVGPYGGFYLRLSSHAIGICLGWLAITLYRFDMEHAFAVLADRYGEDVEARVAMATRAQEGELHDG